VAQAGFAWPQVPALHKVSGVWVVSGFWLRWRVGIRTLPTRLTRHSSGRGLCFAVLRLASSAAPLNWGVRHLPDIQSRIGQFGKLFACHIFRYKAVDVLSYQPRLFRDQKFLSKIRHRKRSA